MNKRYAVLLCTLYTGYAEAQSGNYYNSRERQNAEYKSQSEATKRAYNVPERQASTPANNNSSSPANSSRPAGTSTNSTGDAALQESFKRLLGVEEKAAAPAAAPLTHNERALKFYAKYKAESYTVSDANFLRVMAVADGFSKEEADVMVNGMNLRPDPNAASDKARYETSNYYIGVYHKKQYDEIIRNWDAVAACAPDILLTTLLLKGRIAEARKLHNEKFSRAESYNMWLSIWLSVLEGNKPGAKATAAALYSPPGDWELRLLRAWATGDERDMSLATKYRSELGKGPLHKRLMKGYKYLLGWTNREACKAHLYLDLAIAEDPDNKDYRALRYENSIAAGNLKLANEDGKLLGKPLTPLSVN